MSENIKTIIMNHGGCSFASLSGVNVMTKLYAHNPHYNQISKQSTIGIEETSLLGRIRNSLGFYGKLRYKKKILYHSGIRLYLCCAELVDYPQIMKDLELDDTFNSWFRVMELHIWMTMVRLSEERMEGKLTRNSLVEHMWKDVDKRSKKLGAGASQARRDGIQQLSEEFKAGIFAYDEGMLSDDRVLAGALWRTFFQRSYKDPRQLELMVHYVRKQLHHLQSQDASQILGRGLVTFLPLHGDEPDVKRNQQITESILSRT